MRLNILRAVWTLSYAIRILFKTRQLLTITREIQTGRNAAFKPAHKTRTKPNKRFQTFYSSKILFRLQFRIDLKLLCMTWYCRTNYDGLGKVTLRWMDLMARHHWWKMLIPRLISALLIHCAALLWKLFTRRPTRFQTYCVTCLTENSRYEHQIPCLLNMISRLSSLTSRANSQAEIGSFSLKL